MSTTLPDKYRAVNKTDTVEIRRYPDSNVDYEPTTIPKEFKRTCVEHKDRTAIVSKEERIYTFGEYYQLASSFAKSLIKLGFELKDSVNMIGFNSPEYHFALQGTWLAGGVTAGIYTTNSEEACRYVLEHSEARYCLCESGKQFQKILSLRENLPSLKAIIVYWQTEELPEVKDDGFAKIYKFEDFIKLGEDLPDSVIDERIERTVPGSCATLIYTSGTTGNPKGVMLSHDNCTHNAHVMVDRIGILPGDRFIGYLPLNHIAAQYIDTMILLYAPTITYMARPDALKGSLVATMKKVKPNIFVGVPRVFEKVAEGVKKNLNSNSSFKKALIEWVRGIGTQTALSRQYGKTIYYPWFYSIAKRLVFNKIRSNLGLDECRTMVVSTAPVTEETLQFFASFDMPILDLLGQSEGTAPIASCTSLNQEWRIGSVGRPVPGVQIKIDPQNKEILFRGRNVMMGYLKQAGETLSTLDDEGWIHTGDQGELDEDGFLKVTGRIKELIITAGGENISPVIIESKVMELSPIFDCVMAVGDKRKFISLLVCLRCDMQADGEPSHNLSKIVTATLQGLGSNATTIEEAMNDPIVKNYIDGVVAEYNKVAVSRAQEIRKWCIMPEEFSLSRGELTATMKLRRSVVQEHYAKEIDKLYEWTVC